MGGVLTEASEHCSKDWLSGGAGRPCAGLGAANLPGLPVESARGATKNTCSQKT